MFCKIYDPIVDGVGRHVKDLEVVHLSLAKPDGKAAAQAYGLEGALPVTYLHAPGGEPLATFHGAAVDTDLYALLKRFGLHAHDHGAGH